MINVDETFSLFPFYYLEEDFFWQAFLSACGVIFFVEILRGQVSEVNLLQLVPGVYLFLLFISFLFLFYLSFSFFHNVFKIDAYRVSGVKTGKRAEFKLQMKMGLFLFLSELILILNTVIPLSLECFNSYGEKTLENTWSLGDVVSLETFLLTVLLFLSQTPLYLLLDLNCEISTQELPIYWRRISFLIVLISGFVTPTIDGYTQISFAGSTLFLYLFSISVADKRISLRAPVKINYGN